MMYKREYQTERIARKGITNALNTSKNVCFFISCSLCRTVPTGSKTKNASYWLTSTKDYTEIGHNLKFVKKCNLAQLVDQCARIGFCRGSEGFVGLRALTLTCNSTAVSLFIPKYIISSLHVKANPLLKAT